MKSKFKTMIFVLILTMVSVASVCVCQNLTVSTHAATFCSAKAMCVLDKDSKRVLYNKNSSEKLPMASTTKVMTAITVLENCSDLEQVITIDDKAVGIEGTSIYLRKGEQISVMDLLYGLMLRSGNDSAAALAYHVAGGVEKFAKLMNELAVKIGATNSHFANPHGLDNPDHYTTAYDLALIAGYALGNPNFKKIVSTKSHIIPATNMSDKRYLSNKNRLLSSLDGCCGVKTGFTSKAGRCLVSASERNGHTIVAVVLNCGPMFEESADLIDSGFEEFTYKKIIDKDKQIYNEYVTTKEFGRLYLFAKEDVFYPFKASENNEVTLKYAVKLEDAAPGNEVGKVDIYLNNQLLNSAKLYTMNMIEKLIDNNTLQIKEILWEEKINENK